MPTNVPYLRLVPPVPPKEQDRWPRAPKSLKPILRDQRVEDYSDERSMDQGYWVYLTPGWCCEPGLHTIHEDTIAAVKRVFNGIEKCPKGCTCGWDDKSVRG